MLDFCFDENIKDELQDIIFRNEQISHGGTVEKSKLSLADMRKQALLVKINSVSKTKKHWC